MVLIALMLVILVGFAALAIDSGRLYAERRTIQNAVDAAALAASDNYQDSLLLSASNQAAASEYAANERIYGTASPNPSWSSAALTVTWAGSADSLVISSSVVGTIATFTVSSTHSVRLTFAVVLGVGTSANVTASAQGQAKTGGTHGSGLVTLGTGTCSGAGTASLSISGGATISITGGNAQINGSANISSGTVNIASGTWKNNCGGVPGTVTASGGKTSGNAAVADPAFPPGPLADYTGAMSAGSNVTLNPGIYSTNIAGSSGACYFLAAGIYQMNGGFNATNGYFSNFLRSPDEAAWVTNAPDYNSNVANPQWWGSCAGSFTTTAVASAAPLTPGSWGAVITSTRSDYYPPAANGGTLYARESAPSTCHAVTLAAGQSLKVTVNNVPGATGYRVYLAYRAAGGSACATGGPWGYAGAIVNGVTETQAARGSVNGTFDANAITQLPILANISNPCAAVGFSLNCAASTGQFGSAVPPGDGGETAPMVTGAGLPPGSPARDITSQGGGDRANEHQCLPSGSSSSAPCDSATVTPGAIQLYFPAGQCYSLTNNGNMRLFSGYQFNWMAIYAPTANTCATLVGDSSTIVVVGTYYWPAGAFTTSGNPGYLIYFTQVVVGSYDSQGNENLTISYDVTSTAPQGFSRLSL